MKKTISKNAISVLDAIEDLEFESLSWGYAHVCLSEKEVDTILMSKLSDQDLVDVVLEELLTHKLLFEFEKNGEFSYRSRVCEFVRLAVSNRQQFPRLDWQSAPPLVSDYRIDRRKRVFPKRNVSFDDVMQALGIKNENFHAKALKALLLDKKSEKLFELSGFQVRSLERLLLSQGEHGTVITAGTGSGKTLGFYLPAFLRIGELIDRFNWVKALAVYPRQELLKDQMLEAFKLARKLDDLMLANRKRKVRIGAFFGPTPFDAQSLENDKGSDKWIRKSTGYVCPWFNCPNCDDRQVNSELIWRFSDLKRGVEILSCSSENCDFSTNDDELILTRKSLTRSDRIPDILFTTTETLNTRISDLWSRHAFGVGVKPEQRPRFLLLDEIHTFEGASGAQNALTLRRWRKALGRTDQLHWVGLSATLDRPEEFFETLTNLDLGSIVNVKPEARLNEVEESGAEYQLLLRNNPTVRTAVLSTTIQTAMLLPRMLDPIGRDLSGGLFGKKVFVFTDKLDLVNRLYDDLKDAEAYDRWGNIDPTRLPLTALRGRDAMRNQTRIRDAYGQNWKSCEDVGYDLSERIMIGRTSGLDSGVSKDAKVIAATASLEVGYNDGEVGATIQHTAPRSNPSYLQRKGRAGRSRNMRPISVTILSDFGRDRTKFQNYEQLFDPVLGIQTLPVSNIYIQKIQATYALFDWLASYSISVNADIKGAVWDVLSAPLESSAKKWKLDFRDQIRTILQKLLTLDPNVTKSFENYLTHALSLSSDQVEKIMWEHPRSLMLEVIPTIFRRMYRNWDLAFAQSGITKEFHKHYHPAPEFIPNNLFSELSIPEVSIVVPKADANDAEKSYEMPLRQALTEFAPGNVTRRFGTRAGRISHWIPIDAKNPKNRISISDIARTSDFIGSYRDNLNFDASQQIVNVYRPWEIAPVVSSRAIGTSSKSFLNWGGEIFANGNALEIPIAKRSHWRELFDKVDLYFHRQRSFATVRRFAVSATASTKVNRQEFESEVEFIDANGQPAALGFELEVDALRIGVPTSVIKKRVGEGLNKEQILSLRYSFARDFFIKNKALSSDINQFQREWLFQFITVFVLKFYQKKTDDIDSYMATETADLKRELHNIVGSWFVNPVVSAELYDLGGSDSDELNSSGHQENRERLQEVLINLIDREDVFEQLKGSIRELIRLENAQFVEWLEEVTIASLGEALLQACVISLPSQSASEDLNLDIEVSDGGEVVYWISESTSGGAGVLEALAYEIADSPNLLFDALDAVISPSDLEQTDSALEKVVQLSVKNPEVEGLIKNLRRSNSIEARRKNYLELSKRLNGEFGLHISEAISVSLNSRLLRLGANNSLDKIYYALLELRNLWETKIGFVIPNREFAFFASDDAQINQLVREYLSSYMSSDLVSTISTISTVESLLWIRDFEVRREELKTYNPYRADVFVDPIVVRNLQAKEKFKEVFFSLPDWKQQVSQALHDSGVVSLSVQIDEISKFQEQLFILLANPINVDALQFYPSIDAVSRSNESIAVTLILREQVS